MIYLRRRMPESPRFQVQVQGRTSSAETEMLKLSGGLVGGAATNGAASNGAAPDVAMSPGQRRRT